ncbi:RNA polymerase sigma-70 factor [Odoribacter sp. AF15-53]|uniref:RNA polymerase sigma-70 factor n=1 Tax=Odoribacter sp. AF15-53 TaxID=2292236 RepID=UPI000E4A9017|nr:RNA polymerase sigma-70 factor [Odoribacter sp. AF15-53]RHR76081.1 RNA polymerase sigma-70 factor [Odoribacter sp. AF15-53]
MIFPIFVIYLCTMDKAETILNMFKVAEKEAFQLLYSSYYETLVLFANQIIDDSQAAEDIVQDCLVKFWISKRYRTLESGLDKYIFQAVKFSSLNYVRGDRRKKNLHENVIREMMSEEDLPEEENVEILEMVYKVIDLLPEERRHIFLMVFVDGMSYQEVADQLQISKNTVKTQLSRSLKFLRDTLKDRYNAFLLFFILKK